jgi:hypothetical protein
MTLVGYITPTRAYTFDDDFEYSFHTAVRDDEALQVFPSRMDTWPSITAKAEGVDYKFLRNSTQAEIGVWFDDHPEVNMKKSRLL